MNERKLVRKLIGKNILHQKDKYFFVLIIMFLMNLFIFLSYALIASAKEGVRLSKNRLGADMVVCMDTETEPETLIYGDTPATIYMPYAYVDELRNIPHITEFTERLYLATMEGQSCCDGRIQLIAVKDDDYLLQALSHIKALHDNEILLGNAYMVSPGDTVRYFGRTFTVADVLDKTNTGYDRSGFITIEAASEIMHDPSYADYFNGRTPDEVTSMVFISSDAPQATYNLIRSNHRELTVYLTDRKISEYTARTSSFSDIAVVMNILLIAIGTASLTALSCMSTEVRKNEIGTMIAMGVTRNQVRCLMTLEQLTFMGLAYIISLVPAVLLALFMSSFISSSVGIPFDFSWKAAVAAGAVLLAVDLAVCIFSAGYGLRKVLKVPSSELIKVGS